MEEQEPNPPRLHRAGSEPRPAYRSNTEPITFSTVGSQEIAYFGLWSAEEPTRLQRLKGLWCRLRGHHQGFLRCSRCGAAHPVFGKIGEAGVGHVFDESVTGESITLPPGALIVSLHTSDPTEEQADD